MAGRLPSHTDTALFFSPPKGTEGEATDVGGEERREAEGEVSAGVGNGDGKEV